MATSTDTARHLLLQVVVSGAVFGAVVACFSLWWPLGIAVGLAIGILVVLRIGRQMHAVALSEVTAPGSAVLEESLVEG